MALLFEYANANRIGVSSILASVWEMKLAKNNLPGSTSEFPSELSNIHLIFMNSKDYFGL